LYLVYNNYMKSTVMKGRGKLFIILHSDHYRQNDEFEKKN
jgi:hypothetical protein